MARFAWRNWVCKDCGHEWNGPWFETKIDGLGYTGFPPICPNTPKPGHWKPGGHWTAQFSFVEPVPKKYWHVRRQR